jgi:hypothetical protein
MLGPDTDLNGSQRTATDGDPGLILPGLLPWSQLVNYNGLIIH